MLTNATTKEEEITVPTPQLDRPPAPTLLDRSLVLAKTASVAMEPFVEVCIYYYHYFLVPVSFNNEHIIDVNECLPAGGNNCDANADCTNTAGSFTCACKNGYFGTGVNCTGELLVCHLNDPTRYFNDLHFKILTNVREQTLAPRLRIVSTTLVRIPVFARLDILENLAQVTSSSDD